MQQKTGRLTPKTSGLLPHRQQIRQSLITSQLIHQVYYMRPLDHLCQSLRRFYHLTMPTRRAPESVGIRGAKRQRGYDLQGRLLCLAQVTKAILWHDSRLPWSPSLYMRSHRPVITRLMKRSRPLLRVQSRPTPPPLMRPSSQTTSHRSRISWLQSSYLHPRLTLQQPLGPLAPNRYPTPNALPTPTRPHPKSRPWSPHPLHPSQHQ